LREHHGVILVAIRLIVIPPIGHVTSEVGELPVKDGFHLLPALVFRDVLFPAKPPAVRFLKFLLDLCDFFLIEQEQGEDSRPASADDEPVSITAAPAPLADKAVLLQIVHHIASRFQRGLSLVLVERDQKTIMHRC
jgi:hypothetical protein